MISFDKIVNKMLLNEGKILSVSDISSMFFPDSLPGKRAGYKLTSRLKANNIIISIKNGLFFINNAHDISEIDLIDTYYWKILKKIITSEIGTDYCITANKAIEILLKDYSIPTEIIIYTKDVTKKVQISSNHRVYFRMIQSGKRSKGVNLFPKIIKNTKIVEIEGQKFKIANEELALLDGLLIHKNEEGINTYLLEKFIKKFSKIFSRERLGNLVSMKYLTSINRLRALSQKFKDDSLYRQCVDIIKKEGANCFISVTR